MSMTIRVTLAVLFTMIPFACEGQYTAGPDRDNANQALVVNGGSSGVIANGWKFVAQRQFLMQMAMQQAVTQQVLGNTRTKPLPDGDLVVPVTHFSRVSQLDLAPAFAKMMLQRSSQYTLAQYTQYVRERTADFTQAVQQAGLPLDSFPTACTYYIESLYEVGADQPVSTDRQHDIVRGSCVLLTSSLQTQGQLKTDRERQTFYDAMGIIASGLRWEVADAIGKNDPKAEGTIRKAAHDLLADAIGREPRTTPVDHLPCAFVSEDRCEETLPRLQSYLIANASRYP